MAGSIDHPYGDFGSFCWLVNLLLHTLGLRKSTSTLQNLQHFMHTSVVSLEMHLAATSSLHLPGQCSFLLITVLLCIMAAIIALHAVALRSVSPLHACFERWSMYSFTLIFSHLNWQGEAALKTSSSIKNLRKSQKMACTSQVIGLAQLGCTVCMMVLAGWCVLILRECQRPMATVLQACTQQLVDAEIAMVNLCWLWNQWLGCMRACLRSTTTYCMQVYTTFELVGWSVELFLRQKGGKNQVKNSWN